MRRPFYLGLVFGLLLLAYNAQSGRNRPPAKPVLIPHLSADPPHEVRVDYLLGPGYWIPLNVGTPVYQGDCIDTYEVIGLRLRYCLIDVEVEVCSEQTEVGPLPHPCARLLELR